MMFQVTAVEFDFEADDEYVWGSNEQQQIVDGTLEKVWIAEDENDLVDEITWATGWCVKSLEFVVLPDEEVKLKSGRSVFV